MERPKYLTDNYLKEFTTTVKEVNKDKFIILKDTIFYPNSGGQPNDTGTITKSDNTYNVLFVGKFEGEVSHEVDKEGLKPGDEVTLVIDWPRRYKHMRYHTAAHVVSQIIEKHTGAKITGNQLTLEKGRIDFNLENYDVEKLKDYIAEANMRIKEGHKVKKYFLPREEALARPELFSLKNALPPNVEELRIVEIENFDITACGGTHVENINEIGTITFLKGENKGKNNRRLYFSISD